MSEEIKKIIKEELVAQGLEMLENDAILAFKALMKAAPRIAAITSNPYDDFAVQILPFVEPKVLALIDKIDHKEG